MEGFDLALNLVRADCLIERRCERSEPARTGRDDERTGLGASRRRHGSIPARPLPPRSSTACPCAGMSRHQDEQVVIDAGPVTLKGTPQEVGELAEAAGLYAPRVNPRRMSKDESDHIMTGVYVGVGLLLTAGAGYLAWRYLLDDAQKQALVNKSKDLVADGMTRGKRIVRDTRAKANL